MLIRFGVENFRSFLDRQSISFAASSDRSSEITHFVKTDLKTEPWLAKTRVIFGPNGSGKSNLIAAMATLRFLVRKSASCSAAEYAQCCTPFQSQRSIEAPTYFAIDVLIDGVRYQYSLAYDRGGIRYERLLAYKTGKPQQWFERRAAADGTVTWAPFSPLLHGMRESWRKATRPEALFVTTAAHRNAEQLRPFVDWIDHGMDVLFSSERHALKHVAARIENPLFKARLLKLLNVVDADVRDLRIRADSSGTTLEFLHDRAGLGPTWLEPEYEAAGRRHLVILIAALLDSLRKGNFLAIDEFDLRVHPLVARHLMQLVNDAKFAATPAQVLLTSHDVGLLSLEVLRRDEICLMELGADRSSRLSSMLRTGGPRKREKIAKGYLSGKFGGIPEIRPDT